MPRFIEILVKAAGLLAVALRRDDHLFAGSRERIDHSLDAAFTTTQIRALGTDQLLTLTNAQVPAFTNQQLAAMSTAQITVR
jgi:hypothetical protein